MLRKDYIIQLLLSIVLILFYGCDKQIYDDLSDCPTGVYISFYSQTSCASEQTLVGEVSSLYLFAFDEEGSLAWVENTDKINLTKDFEYKATIKPGVYTFYAWAGLDNRSAIADFTVGKTTSSDVFMSFKKDGNESTDLTGLRILQGGKEKVVIHQQTEIGESYKHININMLEITNRINVEIALHESIIKDATPSDFEVVIKSGNNSHLIDGTMPYNQPGLIYPATVSVEPTSLKASFTLPTLKTGYNSTIMVYNKKTDEIIWENDLIGSILLKGNNINLDCAHDFDIRFVIKDKCLDCATYICWAIYLNNWMVHSYQVGVDNDY